MTGRQADDHVDSHVDDLAGNGRVVAAHGRQCMVETAEGRRVLCHTRGKKSDCVVGDRVHWQIAGDAGVIDKVAERRNLLFRQDEWKTKSFAANIDQLLVLVAVEPMYAETQLARALIAAEHAGISTQIILNKTDLPTLAAAHERLEPYRAIGIPVLELSLKSRPDEARALLTPLLAGRATLVLGPSGMGKSTLINLMVPAAAAQVGEISIALNAGRHTTTTIPLARSGSSRRAFPHPRGDLKTAGPACGDRRRLRSRSIRDWRLGRPRAPPLRLVPVGPRMCAPR